MKATFQIIVLSLLAHSTLGQEVYLSPFKKIITPAKDKIELVCFSGDAKRLVANDAKGNLYAWDVESEDLIKQWIPGKSKGLLIQFIDNDKNFIYLDESGAIVQYNTADFSSAQTSQLAGKVKLAKIDPAGHTIGALLVDNSIEIFDLRANMSSAKIQAADKLKKPMFIGYDRFGQQLSVISELGDVLTWNPLNQKFLRELKLRSGEYSGSRSIIHSASTNAAGDRFVIGLQEVFIPKGGMQGRPQPERKNMIISYDWLSGAETKRMPLRYRADEMVFGPGPGHVAYSSKDALSVWMANLERSEVSSSVTLTELASSLTISDNNDYLAVGTEKGNIYLYYIERNAPAEIRVIDPSLDRSYATQTIRTGNVIIKGKVEGNERLSKISINGNEAISDGAGNFSGEVSLVPGKNKVRIVAQNTQNQNIVKDFYVTHEPDAALSKKSVTHSITGKRLALVIGNAVYQYGNRLNNTGNDANAIASALAELGFEVIKILNGSYEDMKNAVYQFGDRIQDADVSVFYYAGHGLEIDGTNYLVPVDANIQSPLDIKQKTVPLPGVIRTMEFANDEGLNMIILDACRNNPFPTGKRGGTGLARVNAPSGTLIAYATDPGSVASDGEGANGLYTGELVKQLKISQRIEDVFMNTRNSVEEKSKGAQRPWEEARLKGVFYLK